MAKYILFDTETTGNSEEDRIIQVGAMIIDSNGDVEVFDESFAEESRPVPSSMFGIPASSKISAL